MWDLGFTVWVQLGHRKLESNDGTEKQKTFQGNRPPTAAQVLHPKP